MVVKSIHDYFGSSERFTYQTEKWIKDLEAAYQDNPIPAESTTAKGQKFDIRYVIKFNAYTNGLSLHGYVAKFLKSGSISRSKPIYYDPETPLSSKIACEVMDDTDWKISILCMKSKRENFYGKNHLQSIDILESIVRSGRGHLENIYGSPLVWGETVPCRFEWVVNEAGNTHRLTPTTGNSSHHPILVGNTPIYIDATRNMIGKLDCVESSSALSALFKAPSIPLKDTKHLKEVFAEKALPLQLVPKMLEIKEVHVLPTPILTVSLFVDDPIRSYAFDLMEEDYFCMEAKIRFDYAGYVEANGQRSENASFTTMKDGILYTVHRDLGFEEKAVNLLTSLGWELESDNVFIQESCFASDIMHFIMKEKPLLEKTGWNVVLDDSFPIHQIFHSDECYYDVASSTAASNWFDVELGILIGGQRINLLPFLKTILKDSKSLPSYLELLAKTAGDANITLMNDKKEVVLLPAEKVLHFLTIFNADHLSSDGLKFSAPRWNIALLDQMGAAEGAIKARWFGEEEPKKMAQALLAPKQIDKVVFPDTFQCELRPYQFEGVAWMQTLRQGEMNGMLADDMGLGKTVQTIAHLVVEKEDGRLVQPCLIVAPTTLLPNWKQELAKFAPHFKVLILHGNNRKQHFGSLKDYDIIVTTYTLLNVDVDTLIAQQFYYLILDEAQAVKNSRTLAYQIVQQINARHRLLLTGTPMENHLGEIWSLFHILMPGFLGKEESFNKIFRRPIEKNGDKQRQDLLSRRLKPFMLRRTKNLVAKELPEKTVIVQRIELDAKQRHLYESIRLKAQEKVMKEIAKKGFNRSQIVVLDALLKMRQACCDPRLVKLNVDLKEIPSAKLNYLKEALPQMVEEGKQIILFSQFTSMLALVQEELVKLKIDHALLTGDTEDRETPIRLFQNKQVPLILLSLKAGGVGLNLTSADTVILFDPWWNPAAENQAIDRAHRIGQVKAVFVYKLVTEGTVEEKILALQEKKKRLLDAVFDSEEGEISKLSMDDLEAIFKPIETYVPGVQNQQASSSEIG